MSIAGIVGEYNPFHSGHAHHLAKTREMLGEDCGVVSVMSGDFVQRGEAAVYSKYARAEAACRCGVNLVLELPLPWSLSSAEGLAHGAVGLLDSLGQLTHLSFGSECGDIDLIRDTAEALIDPAMNAAIKAELGGGVPYAAARQEALRKRDPHLADILDTPNNILAVEYVKALYDEGSRMEPVTVRRFGAGHDQQGHEEGPRSASEIRHRLAGGDNLCELLPEAAAQVFEREESGGRGFMAADALETAILSRLRLLDIETYNRLPDSGGGVGTALYNASREEESLDGLAARTKSRSVAMSRIRRMIMCAALGVTAGMSDGIPPYARVLAADDRGREILRAASSTSDIPIITKPADAHNLDARGEAVFSLGAAAHDFYVLGYRARGERRGGADWRTGPAIV